MDKICEKVKRKYPSSVTSEKRVPNKERSSPAFRKNLTKSMTSSFHSESYLSNETFGYKCYYRNFKVRIKLCNSKNSITVATN
jgi:hypothetical protein